MNKHKVPELKKSELETGVTYFLCPDKECELFWSLGSFPCESNCPYQDKLVKIIKCGNCGDMIELPGNHSQFLRIDHKCPSEREAVACNFRMSGKSQIIYKKPGELK